MNPTLLIIGIILLFLTLVCLLFKGTAYEKYIPATLMNNLKFLVVGSLLIIGFGFAGILGLIIAGVIGVILTLLAGLW